MVTAQMSSTQPVPETRLISEGELPPDHAWRALRGYGGWRLLRDAIIRFRYGDGNSHARAVALQLCLAAVPLRAAGRDTEVLITTYYTPVGSCSLSQDH